MTLRSAWPRFAAGLVATAAIYVSSGCSFFYELNTTQCEVSSDCIALGEQFRNTTCINRVCVEKSSSGATGGTSNNGGSGNGGTGNGGAGKPSTGGDTG